MADAPRSAPRSAPRAASAYLSRWPEGSDSRAAMRGALAAALRAMGEPGDVESFDWGRRVGREAAASLPARLRSLDRADGREKLAVATVNRCLSALRGVLDEAVALGEMTPEARGRVGRIKSVKGRASPAGRALEEAEVDAVARALAGWPEPREAAALAALAACGLRRVEVARLRREDYDPREGRLVARGKGGKARSVPVGRRWRPAIERWWASARAREPLGLSRRQLSYLVERLWRACGDRRFTPHDLRRTFATRVIERSDVLVAQRLLGHEHLETTGIYDRRGRDAEDRAVEDL